MYEIKSNTEVVAIIYLLGSGAIYVTLNSEKFY